jgi:hypothetical protein
MALETTDVSKERVASIIRVTRTGELGTTLAVTNNRSSALQLLVTVNVVPSSPVLTRATKRHIPEDGMLHSDCCAHLLVTPLLPRGVLQGVQIRYGENVLCSACWAC